MFRNRYHSHLWSGASFSNPPATEALKREKAMAFSKTASYMESALVDGAYMYIFKVFEVHKSTKTTCKTWGWTKTPQNLKTDLLEKFQKSTVWWEEYSVGVSWWYANCYQTEVLGNAKYIHEEMFAYEQVKFSGSFPQIVRAYLCHTISHTHFSVQWFWLYKVFCMDL